MWAQLVYKHPYICNRQEPFMRYLFLCLLSLSLLNLPLAAQYAYQYKPAKNYIPGSLQQSKFDGLDAQAAKAKLFQRNYGVILGVQRGQSTFIEFGSEIHWRKVRLTNPRLLALTGNVSYNIANNVLGYQAGFWTKRGRIALTLGANAAYFTDFDKGSFALDPSVGFRLLGFHLNTGYYFLLNNEGETATASEVKLADKVNNFHIGLRYYFPLDNKLNWKKKAKADKDGKDKDKEKKKKRKEKAKKKKKKAKAKAKQKKARQQDTDKDNKNSAGKKWKPFDFLKK